MKKIVLFVLAASVVLAATLTLGTSCRKDDNSGKVALLRALIAQAELLSPSDYTTVS